MNRRFWLIAAAAQAGFFGFILFFRNFYYHWDWIALRIPDPPLYADVSSVFLLVIAGWTLYVAFNNHPTLWIIPAGSALGRTLYFFISIFGFLTGINEGFYVLIGLTDIFFAIILVKIALEMRKEAIFSNNHPVQ